MEWLRAFARASKRSIARRAPALARWLPRLGGLLLALAVLFAGHSWWQDRALLHATATVTENVAAFAPGGGVSYHPRLRFRTPDGESVQVLATQGRPEPEFAAGSSLPVAWPVGDPQHAVIATVWRVYAAAIWLGILGTVLFDAGWVLRLAGARKAAK
jgi:hypothetical protein